MESSQPKAENHVDSDVREPEKSVSRAKSTIVLCTVYLIALAAVGYVTSYMTVTGGIVLYFAILLGLIISSTLDKDPGRRALWLALGLSPLIRIVSLVVPQPELSEISRYLITGIAAGVCAFAVMRILKISAREAGINLRMPLAEAVVAVTGIALGFIGYLIIRPEALNGGLSIQETIFPAFVLLVFSGFMEELVFRGVMQNVAGGVLGSLGWVYVALVYGVLQIGQGSLLHGLFVFLAALCFGWEVKRTSSITGVSLAHGLLNIVLFLIFPHIL